MFNNPGAKIKGLAKTLFWIEVVILVLAVLFVGADELFEEIEGIIGAVVILAVGVGAAYISALFLAAFGELVETNTSIAQTNAQLLEEAKKRRSDGEYMKG